MNTTANSLPRLGDLQDGQALLEVLDYEEFNDLFYCKLHTNAPCEGQECNIPALLLPMLVYEYGEPQEFLGRAFLVERGAKKADYTRLHNAVHVVVETLDHQLHVNEPFAVPVPQTNNLFDAFNASPQPYQL